MAQSGTAAFPPTSRRPRPPSSPARPSPSRRWAAWPGGCSGCSAGAGRWPARRCGWPATARASCAAAMRPCRRDKRFADPAWSAQPGLPPAGAGLPRPGRGAEPAGRRLRGRGRGLARRRAGPVRGRRADQRAVADEHAARQPGGAQAGVRHRRGQRRARASATSPHDVRHNGGHALADRPHAPSPWARTWPSRPGDVIAPRRGGRDHRSTARAPRRSGRGRCWSSRRPSAGYYFLDLRPGRSFVEYAVSRGLQVFMLSWRNPTAEAGGLGHRHLRRADPRAPAEVVKDVAGVAGRQHARLLRRRHPPVDRAGPPRRHRRRARVHCASFAVTLLDFDVRAPIGAFSAPAAAGAGPARLAAQRRHHRPVAGHGVQLDAPRRPGLQLRGQQLADGRGPAGLRHPGLERRRHEPARRAARRVPRRSSATTPSPKGALTVLGTPVDLGRITVPEFVTGALNDHLTPWTGATGRPSWWAGRAPTC